MSGLTDFPLLEQPVPAREPLPLHLNPLAYRCNECRVNDLCLPTGLPLHDNRYLGTLIGPRIRVRKGAALFNANVPLSHLYSVYSGSFKTNLNNAEAGCDHQFLDAGGRPRARCHRHRASCL